MALFSISNTGNTAGEPRVIIRMHYTLFIAHFNQEDLVPVKSVLTGLNLQADEEQGKDVGQGGACDEHLVSFCCIDQQCEFLLDTIEQNGEWQTLSSVTAEKALQDVHESVIKQDSSKAQKTIKLSEHLHKLADELPYAGFTLDVYIVHSKLNNESRTHILGSLMRLREWHGAQITIILESAAEQEHSAIRLLASVLHTKVLSTDQLTPAHSPLWRGVLAWPSEKGFVQTGVCLNCDDSSRMKDKMGTLFYWKRKPKRKRISCDYEEIDSDLVFGRRLEVVTCISLGSVPLYYIDNFNLRLHVEPNSRFGQLARALTSEEALLLRLPVYEKFNVPSASSHGLSTSAWKEGIATSGRPTPDPEKEPLLCRQHLFLLISGKQKDSDQLCAIVMRSPSEFNVEVFKELHRASYFGFESNSETSDLQPETCKEITKRVEKAVHGLPLLSASAFQSVDNIWSQSVIDFVNTQKRELEKKGKDFQLTAEDLVSCMVEGQETFLQHGRLQNHREQRDKKPLTHHDFLVLPDLQGPSSEWPEKQAMSESESKAKVLRRYQSSDSCSLMLSSPLGPDESSLDARDMVKWFKPDGNAVQEDLSPVKVVVRPQRLSSHDERTLQWPACKNLRYHDIYYQHQKRCERQEQFFQKFRDTIMLEEGHNVCAEKPHVPALRFRGDHRKRELDVSCGGSKLTPISRTLSSSSLLAATPSAKQRHDRRLSAERPRKTSSSGGERQHSAERSSRHSLLDKRHFPTPQFQVRQDKFSSQGVDAGSSLSQDFLLPGRRGGDAGSGSLLHPGTSTPNVLPVRRLSHASDTVNIFTSPAVQKQRSQASSSGSFSEKESPKFGRSLSSTSMNSSAGDSQDRRLSSESIDSQASARDSVVPVKESRSQRHKRKLEEIIGQVLNDVGISTSDIIYNSCFTKLFQVTKFYVKQLPNSRNLKEEMRSIANKQVQQVVDLERRRQDLAVKKKLRKSSLVV